MSEPEPRVCAPNPSRYQEGFTAGYRKAQEDLGVDPADRAASYKVTEVENYRLALAWISKQSNDPKSRELASEALEAFEASADTSTDGSGVSMTVRTPSDGRPYYCSRCGWGFAEYLACDEVDCELESNETAEKRRISQADGGARETLIGGTNWCGHGMMASLCPRCSITRQDGGRD
jgi:hypothetical protein